MPLSIILHAPSGSSLFQNYAVCTLLTLVCLAYPASACGASLEWSYATIHASDGRVGVRKVQLQGRKTITAEDFHNAYLTRQDELTCIDNVDCCFMCVWGGGGMHSFIVLLCLDTRLTIHKHK